MSDFLSFHLPLDFVKSYAKKKPQWGFDIGGGNSLGEITFIDKYSRRKEDGTKERWHEACERVINGMYSILKDHCKTNQTPWNENKAQKAAQDAFDRMWSFKWTPPGRGIWMMGSEFVNERRNSAALQNCAFISTEKLSNHSVVEATLPFIRLMEMSMLGVGVGFDAKGAGKLQIHQPSDETVTIVIEDSREGWYESVGSVLEAVFFNRPQPIFDYSLIRPAGEPIKGFGGTAAGPEPLRRVHEELFALFHGRAGEYITSSDIVDVMNMIGKCVVAGNVRRSAEIALGYADDEAFLDLKNWEVNPERMAPGTGWGHISNNSVFATVGMDYSGIVERTADAGEPGYLYMDLCRDYGRLVDPPDYRDYRAAGTNPCGEQTLESYECCTLVETFPFKHDSLEDYKKTLKQAYLYAKAVTLLPTHWPETNEVMQRNRRIGCSMSGVAEFVESHDYNELRVWCDESYKMICDRDRIYSEWLGVRESIKKTSIKPSGTVSILAGATPGAHWMPGDEYHIRRMRFAINNPIVSVFADAGYLVEPCFNDPATTVVVEFPAHGPALRTQAQVSIWEKADLAATLQRHWADNQVSVTLTFTPEEKDQIGRVLTVKEGQLKSVSFLPISVDARYKQMPYENIDKGRWKTFTSDVQRMDLKRIYAGESWDAAGERFCNNDSCLI